MAEEKNAKNSPGAGDINLENGCIGVNWAWESKYPIGFCISATVLEILLKYHWKIAKITPGSISVALKMWERGRIVECDI